MADASATLDAKLARLEKLKSEINQLENEIGDEISSRPVNENLIFFYGGACPYTPRAEKLIQCLERHTQRPVVRMETWQNKDNYDKFVEVGGPDKCGGVPFLFNMETKESICGVPRTLDQVKQWAGVAADQ